MFLILSQFPIQKNKFLIKIKIIIKEIILLRQWRYLSTLMYQKPGGSKTVIDSLINELIQKKVSFEHNSFALNQFYEVVFVLADLDCLQWAIKQKMNGYIKKIIVGPFISTLPFDNHFALDSEHINGLLFVSNWLPNIFFKTYKHKNRPYKIWYSGIDHVYWNSEVIPKNRQYILYIKSDHFNISKIIERHLKLKNVKFKILRYGSYSKEQYKNELQKSCGVIFISPSETQGLAMFESWSCNVPTIHWNPEMMLYLGKKYEPASSCPYLDQTLGLSFKSVEEFSQKFEEFRNQISQFSPRKKILEKYKVSDSTNLFLNHVDYFSQLNF